VLDRRRTALLPEILNAFDERLDARRGIVRADVVSARELTETERDDLRNTLERLTSRRVEASYKLDPELIGGAVVRIGSTIYDGSVRARLERLHARLVSS
jgi:F-type H+-transporting ATPase subunit delta